MMRKILPFSAKKLGLFMMHMRKKYAKMFKNHTRIQTDLLKHIVSVLVTKVKMDKVACVTSS